MNDQNFKKHLYVLLAIFTIFTISLIRGNQESVNVAYYLLPIGIGYALYISISKMLYEKNGQNQQLGNLMF